MKITQLNLYGFGKFQNKVIDLDDFAMLFGGNEAGKSTIHAFIKYMLFGFENAKLSNRNFEPLSPSVTTYGGALTLETVGQTIVLERVKHGAKVSFSAVVNGNEAIDEKTWQEVYLAPMTTDLFDEIFTISADNLQVTTSKDYTADDLDRMWRYAATTGSRELYSLIEEAEKSRDQLYTTPQAKSKPILQQLNRVQTLNREIAAKEHEEAKIQPLLMEFEVRNQKIQKYSEELEDHYQASEGLRQALFYKSDILRYQDLAANMPEMAYSEDEMRGMLEVSDQLEDIQRDLARLDEQLYSQHKKQESYGTQLNQFLRRPETEDRALAFNESFAKYERQLQKYDTLPNYEVPLFVGLGATLVAALIWLTKQWLPIPAIIAISAVLLVLAVVLFVLTAKIHKQDRKLNNKLTASSQILRTQAEYFEDWFPLRNKSTEELGQVLGEVPEKIQHLRDMDAALSMDVLVRQRHDLEAQEAHLLERYPDLGKLADLSVTYESAFAHLREKEALEERLGELASQELSVAAMQAEFDDHQAAILRLQAEMATLEKENNALSGKMEVLSSDATLNDLVDELAVEQERLRELVVAYTTQALRVQALTQIFEAQAQTTLPDILAKASQYLSTLTDGEWQAIGLDDKDMLEIRDRDGLALRLIDLSTGTRDQLLFALRLAFIESKHLDFPVLLDDNFLRFDEGRKRNFMTLLDMIATQRQIILTTSDQTLANLTEREVYL
jgi:uncharacterized protein YhaN